MRCSTFKSRIYNYYNTLIKVIIGLEIGSTLVDFIGFYSLWSNDLEDYELSYSVSKKEIEWNNHNTNYAAHIYTDS